MKCTQPPAAITYGCGHARFPSTQPMHPHCHDPPALNEPLSTVVLLVLRCPRFAVSDGVRTSGVVRRRRRRGRMRGAGAVVGRRRGRGRAELVGMLHTRLVLILASRRLRVRSAMVGRRGRRGRRVRSAGAAVRRRRKRVRRRMARAGAVMRRRGRRPRPELIGGLHSLILGVGLTDGRGRLRVGGAVVRGRRRRRGRVRGAGAVVGRRRRRRRMGAQLCSVGHRLLEQRQQRRTPELIPASIHGDK